MSLTRIDSQTALNLDAVAFIAFSGDAEDLSATVNFLASGSPAQSSGFLSETFSGEAARNLFNLFPVRSWEKSDSEVHPAQFTSSPFVVGLGRNKAWYYHKGPDGRGYFLAFVNAKGSCSMRTFDAETGRFLGKKYPEGGGAYQDKFARFIQSAKELFVSSQPNLERDCKDRLPKFLLDDLQKQLS